jgi:dienelactone hydrolase
MTAELNASTLTDASVFCHPSLLALADIDSLRSPAAFALAELDDAFPEKTRTLSEKKLSEKKLDHEFVVYDGTTHGFAMRGNLDVEVIRKGQQGAIDQTAQWFIKYL